MTLRSAIAVCAKEHPEFVRMLTAELHKKASHDAQWMDAAKSIANHLKGRLIPVPLDRPAVLRNFRNPQLKLDTFVGGEINPGATMAYAITGIDAHWEFTTSPRDPQKEQTFEREGTYSALIVPALTKRGRPRDTLLIYVFEEGENPVLSNKLLDEDWRTGSYRIREIADWIKATARRDLENQFEEEHDKERDKDDAMREDAWELARDRAASRRMARDVKTLNVKFKLNGVKILDSYLDEGIDVASGTVAMSGEIGIRFSMGMWQEWPFKGVYDIAQAPSGSIFITNKRGQRLSPDSKVSSLLDDILEEQIGGKLADMLGRHALKWNNTSEATDDNVPTRFVYKGASTTNPAMMTPNQFRYFKGRGKIVERAWRNGEIPKWGDLQSVMKELRKYEEIRKKPGWEDPEQLASLQDAIQKMEIYIKGVYPTGKPVAPKKKTPNAVFLEQMVEPEVKSLVSKMSRFFKGKPAEAAQFAYDVLEDANFHREGGNMNVAMADYQGLTKVAPSSIAMKLGWDSRVLPFAAALVAAAGDKRAASSMIKTWVQMNKDWYVEAA